MTKKLIQEFKARRALCEYVRKRQDREFDKIPADKMNQPENKCQLTNYPKG